MREARWVIWAMGAAALLAGVGALFTACEPAEGIEGLVIEPSDVTLTPASNTMVFTATLNATGELALPLEWSVTDPTLGTIVGSSGYTASYRSTERNGNNTVRCKDQYGNEGVAMVRQVEESYTLTLTAYPSATLPYGTNECTIVAEGGVGPYSWSVEDSSLGRVTVRADNTAVYRSYAAGSNGVKVRDGNGVSGAIVITQSPKPAAPVVPGPGG